MFRVPRDPHGSSIEECVHVGSSCTPVSVPVPTVELSENRLVSVGCYFGSRNCVERT